MVFNFPRLLPAINAISSYITTNSIGFEKYKIQLQDSVVKSISNRETENKKENLVQSGNYLNRKKHRNENDAIEEDILELDKKILEKKLQEENERAKIKENLENEKNDDKLVKTESPIEDSDNYFNFEKNENNSKEASKEGNSEFEMIEEIVTLFKNHFENKSNEDVLNSLMCTSFNIQNAFLILTDYEYYKGILWPY